MNRLKNNQKGFGHIEILTVIGVLIVCGFVGWFVYKNYHKTPITHATDTWTGTGRTFNWSDKNNWTNGVPKSGDNLVFNMANIIPISVGIKRNFINDLPNLTVHNIVLKGITGNGDVDFTGKPFSLTGNISDETGNSSNVNIPGGAVFDFENDITLAGDSVIAEYGKNTLEFIQGTFNLNGHHLTLSNVPADYFKGAGTLELEGTDFLYNLGNCNPDLSGTVIIDKAADVTSTYCAFGSSTITIFDPGYWEIAGATSPTSITISNPINVSGEGQVNEDGSITGAISACLTVKEQGCDNNEQVTFSGLVTLYGDTQVGAYTPASAGADNLHVNYVFKDLSKDGYTLTIVSGRAYYPEF